MRAAARLCRLIAALCLLCLPTGVLAQESERRLALVVGVSDYGGGASLPNAVRDAERVAGALTQTGFTVTRLDNPTRGGLRAAVQAIYDAAEAGTSNTTVVFYFAGHATQLGNQNWLIPSRSGLLEGRPTQADFEDASVSAGWVLGKMREAGVARVIFILDACRNEPFQIAARSAEPGLAVMDVAAGGGDTLILFSAEPGRTASDGPAGSNSPFAAALADTIVLPELTVSEVVDQVRARVIRETPNGLQRPYAVGSMPFQFKPARAQSTLAGVVGEARIRGQVDGRALLDAVLETQTMEQIRAAAEQGDAFALYLVSIAYWDGRGGVAKNMVQARYYMRRSAARGFVRAVNALGTLYSIAADGVEADTAEALAWHEVAAEMGNVSAINNMGVIYREAGDIDRAVEKFTLAAERGYAIGWSNLGWLYGASAYGRQDRARALQYHRRAYEAGNLEAAIDVARVLEWGWPNDASVKNPPAALTLLVEAGERGCATCWKAAAGLYASNALGEPDPTMSASLQIRGAEAGDPAAMLDAGRALAAGRGVEKDPVQALAWYERSVALGNVEASGALGLALARGEGAPRDSVRAARFLRAMMRLDQSTDPTVRYQVYVPNYWGFARELGNLIEDGFVSPEFATELQDLRARYGARDARLKRFPVTVDCDGLSHPFYVYVLDWRRPGDETPLDEQAAWLENQRGCTVPADALERFRQVKVEARQTGVDYGDLIVTRLYTTPSPDAAPAAAAPVPQ